MTSNRAYPNSTIYLNSIGDVTISKSSIIKNNIDSLGQGYGASQFYLYSAGKLDLTISNSTIAENRGSYSGAILHFQGSDTCSVQINNSTIYGNITPFSGAFKSIPTWNGSGPCLLNVKGSIFGGNGSTTFEVSGVPDSTINSDGYNIFSDTNSIDLLSTDTVDPSGLLVNLGPLLPHGGTLPSLMPMPPSIAINAGNPTDLSDAKNRPINGVRDIGAVEYCAPSYHSDTIVACSEFTWVNGITYFQSDTVLNYFIVSASGCDSILSLYLTINQPSISHDTIIACDNYTWMDGNTYYISNHTAQHVVTNSVGCDSTIYLHLTITNAIVEKFSVCDSLVWRNGITYYQSNNSAQDTVFSTGICDSIFHLDLTVHQKEYSTQTISACNSYTWSNGITYTSSINTPKDTLVNRFGCDSIEIGRAHV